MFVLPLVLVQDKADGNFKINMTKKPLLISVVGPTAIGKTTLAIALAKTFKTEVLSADSRQFYKEMRIGTAVPSKEELAEVPHHFIHSKSIFDDYSVGDFERDAVQFLSDKYFPSKLEEQAFKSFVMVGGSGLYVDAVVTGLDQFPAIPKGIREKLNAELQEKGIEFLQAKLEQVDIDYYLKVDRNNPHRVIRALEVYLASGKPYSSFLNQPPKEREFDSIIIGLTADREIIYNRINQRVDLMMANGLLEEARELYPHKDQNALQTVGYRELFAFFDGEQSKDQAIKEIKKNTRRFAKRQLTWFRKKPNIHWFDYTTNADEIVAFIKKELP